MAFKIKKKKRKEKKLSWSKALDLIGAEEEGWYSLHWKESKAEEKARELNKTLKNSPLIAIVDFARNYNPQGIDWGVCIVNREEYIKDMKQKGLYEKLKKKGVL